MWLDASGPEMCTDLYPDYGSSSDNFKAVKVTNSKWNLNGLMMQFELFTIGEMFF